MPKPDRNPAPPVSTTYEYVMETGGVVSRGTITLSPVENPVYLQSVEPEDSKPEKLKVPKLRKDSEIRLA